MACFKVLYKSRADLEGGAPGVRPPPPPPPPPKIFPNTIFYYNIVQVRGLKILTIVLKSYLKYIVLDIYIYYTIKMESYLRFIYTSPPPPPPPPPRFSKISNPFAPPLTSNPGSALVNQSVSTYDYLTPLTRLHVYHNHQKCSVMLLTSY